jgi:hypothetical protein
MRTVTFSAFVVLVIGVGVSHASAQVLQSPNTNGQPGNWLPAIPHGSHSVGAACTSHNGNNTRFFPIHAALVPKGEYQGCVLVWEFGGQDECMVGYPGSSSPGTLPTGDVDVRWALFDPRTSPPVIHKFAWRFQVADAPPPPPPQFCPGAPAGYQGLFCGGFCWLPDGRLLVAGGDYWASGFCGANFAGSRIVLVFDPDDIDLSSPFQQANGPGQGKPWRSLHSPAGGQPSVDLHHPR